MLSDLRERGRGGDGLAVWGEEWIHLSPWYLSCLEGLVRGIVGCCYCFFLSLPMEEKNVAELIYRLGCETFEVLGASVVHESAPVAVPIVDWETDRRWFCHHGLDYKEPDYLRRHKRFCMFCSATWVSVFLGPGSTAHTSIVFRHALGRKGYYMPAAQGIYLPAELRICRTWLGAVFRSCENRSSR